MATTEERVARLEGGYEHLATKADVVVLKWAIGVQFALLLLILARVFEIIPAG